jgi:purine-binding chemotaxis protein CheW
MNGKERFEKPASELEEYVQMISFSIGAELFGVKILVVQEIIMIPEVTKIPNSPDFVEGVINLRGNIIPVLDLRKRLRLRNVSRADERKAGTRIIVVETEGNITGFIVDAVSKVISVPSAKVFPPPEILVAGVQSQYIAGVVHLPEGILIILDFKKVLSMDEKQGLERVSKLLPEGESRVLQ